MLDGREIGGCFIHVDFTKLILNICLEKAHNSYHFIENVDFIANRKDPKCNENWLHSDYAVDPPTHTH